MTRSERGSRVPWLVFVTFVALYAASAGARGHSVDGDFAYRLARDVVMRGPTEALGAQQELLRRWGPALPLFGTPFVAAGAALADFLPPAGSVPLDKLPGTSGTVFAHVSGLPPISRDATNGPGDAPSIDLPIPSMSEPITAITIISSLSFASEIPDGTVVANVTVHGTDGAPIAATFPLRAGIETAEWSWGDPSRAPPAHRLASVVGSWDGNANARHFRATMPLLWPVPPAVRGDEPASPAREAIREAGREGAPRYRGEESPPRLTTFREDAGRKSGLGRVVIEAVSPVGRLWIGAVIGSTSDGVVSLTPESPGGALITANRITRAAFGFVNILPAAAVVAMMVPVARAYGGTTRTAIALSGLSGLATLLWPYARLDFAETLAASGAFGAFATRLAAARLDRTPRAARTLNIVAGALALSAGVAKYTALWFAPLIAIDAMVRPGVLSRRTIAGLFLGPGMAACVVALGSGLIAPRIIVELPEGLARGWLGYPLLAGLLSLIASTGKGLVWYAPPVALALVGAIAFARRHGAAAFLPIAAPLLYLLVFGSKPNWHGGGWGPRYLVPMVPFAMVAALPVIDQATASQGRRRLIARVAVALVLAAGLTVNGLGILKHPNAYTIMFRDHIAPQLAGYGAGFGGPLARTYVEHFRSAKAGSELARPPGMPTDIHGTPLPERGLGHLIDRDSPLILKLWPSRPQRFALTLYFVNYDGPPEIPRHQNVTVIDAFEPQTVRVDDFADGVYATWMIDAVPDDPIVIATYDSGRAFPVISGIFFDPTPSPSGRDGAIAMDEGANKSASPAHEAIRLEAGTDRPLPTLDRTTRGAWVGRYGRDGAVLPAYEMGPRDTGVLPPYIDVITGGIPVWVDTGELERSEVALLYAPGFSPIAAHAWLLGNDLIGALFPSATALRQKALASPPWRYVHGLEVHSPHPEYGLGVDLWPLAMRDWFASWPYVMAATWAVELSFVVVAIGGALRLAVAWRESPP